MPHSPHYRTKNFQHLLIKAGFRQAYLPYFLLSQNVKERFINKDSIVFSSIKAEVKPDFAYAMSVQTECRATRAGSQKLCWGEAWLRDSNVSANRMQNLKTRFRKLCWGEAWLREAKIQPKHPEIQIFRAPDIAPHFFTPYPPTTLYIDSQSFQNQFPEKKKVK